MKKLKQVLAVLALIAMAVFVVAVVILVVTGTAEQYSVWMYGPMCVFLVLGLTCLLIDYLMKRAEKAKNAENQQQ